MQSDDAVTSQCIVCRDVRGADRLLSLLSVYNSLNSSKNFLRSPGSVTEVPFWVVARALESCLEF